MRPACAETRAWFDVQTCMNVTTDSNIPLACFSGFFLNNWIVLGRGLSPELSLDPPLVKHIVYSFITKHVLVFLLKCVCFVVFLFLFYFILM